MEMEKKTTAEACPKCGGLVEQEGQLGTVPSNLRCVICGWRKWFGFPDTSTIQREMEPEPGKTGGDSNSHKKKQGNKAAQAVSA